jgi:FSR family fosmidomycin resistance protein-like MFS transporter
VTTVAEQAGVRPNLTLALLSVAHAFNHAQVALLPLVYLAVIPVFHIGVADVALLVAVGSLLSGFTQLTFGLVTRYVPRRLILGAGNVIFGSAMAAMAFTASFLPFAFFNVVSRIGGAPQHPVGNALIAEQFPPRRWAFAIAAHISGGNLGSVAIPIVGSGVIAAIGWQGALIVFGLPTLVLGALMAGLIHETSADREAARAQGSARELYASLLKERDLLFLFASAAIAGGGRGLGVLTTFVPLYLALVRHLEPGLLAAMYAVLLAGSVPAPLVAGWLADRVGHKPMLVATYLGGALALVVFVLAGSSVPLLWLGIVLLAIFNFAESPQLQALLADIVPARTRDVAFSAYFTLAFGVGSLWIAGYGAVIAVLGDAGGFPTVFALMAGAFVAAAIGVLPIHTGSGGAAGGRMDAGSLPPAGLGPASGDASS